MYEKCIKLKGSYQPLPKHWKYKNQFLGHIEVSVSHWNVSWPENLLISFPICSSPRLFLRSAVHVTSIRESCVLGIIILVCIWKSTSKMSTDFRKEKNEKLIFKIQRATFVSFSFFRFTNRLFFFLQNCPLDYTFLSELSGILSTPPRSEQLSQYFWPRCMTALSQHKPSKLNPAVLWHSSVFPLNFDPESSVSESWSAASLHVSSVSRPVITSFCENLKSPGAAAAWTY